jgi:hypothetical protein
MREGVQLEIERRRRVGKLEKEKSGKLSEGEKERENDRMTEGGK